MDVRLASTSAAAGLLAGEVQGQQNQPSTVVLHNVGPVAPAASGVGYERMVHRKRTIQDTVQWR